MCHRVLLLGMVLLVAASAVQAQVDTTECAPIPPRKLSMGIDVGAIHTIPHIAKSDWAAGTINYNDSLQDIKGLGRTGVHFGLSARYKLDSSWAVRAGMILQSTRFQLNYQRSDTATDSIALRANYLAMPIHLEWRPMHRMRHPVSLVLGGRLGYNTTNNFWRGNVDGWLSAGIGWDLRRRPESGGAIIRPEIRYAFGLNDIFRVKTGVYTATVERLTLNGLVFTLYVR